MYGLKETDTMAKSSKEFLSYFQDFFRNAMNSLPKEEKKRGGKANATKKPGGQKNMIGPAKGTVEASEIVGFALKKKVERIEKDLDDK